MNLAMDRETDTQTEELVVYLAELREEAMSYLGISLSASESFFFQTGTTAMWSVPEEKSAEVIVPYFSRKLREGPNL